MKRVLILNPILYTPEYKGRKFETIDDTLLITVCNGFKSIGWDPTLIADIDYRPLKDTKIPFKVIFLKHKYEKIFKSSRMPFPVGLDKFLKLYGNQYDLVISSEVFSWYSYIACKYVKSKLIIWQEMAMHNKMLHGYASRIWYGVIGRLRFRDVRIAPRSKRAYYFISKYCNNVIRDVFQHPVDIKQFQVSENKEYYFISASQLVKRKHIDKIIKAFSGFVKKYPNYTLYICGDGNEKVNLKKEAIELGIEDSVVFKGNLPHDQLGNLLKKAIALLVYTEKDNSILTISEAIACGTPVLTTPVPDNSLFVQDLELGIVKDDWTEKELEKIVLENNQYVNNCKKAREQLTNTFLAKKFIELI